MKVHSATLAGGDINQDRLFVIDTAVILLDGATAFEPVDVDAGHYAETLGAVIAEQLDHQPGPSIADAVAIAIQHTTQKLDLTAGRSPSSTVTVLRSRPTTMDLYVLGDSPIHYGAGHEHQILSDERLSVIARPERERYRSQLRTGHGYGPEHGAILAGLQRAQRRARNCPGGYWIAETDPAAAHHGLAATVPVNSITWAVLATDGAADGIDHRGPSWRQVVHYAPEQLTALLADLHRWESVNDPDGVQLPRAKRHDDKTIATVRFTGP